MAFRHVCTAETTNFARMSCAIAGVCCDILRSVLKATIPGDLSDILKSQKSHLRKSIKGYQQLILYPSTEEFSLEKVDSSLLYALIRSIQGINITAPKKGWGKTPDSTDRSPAANIERLRIQRNETYGHLPSASLRDDEFKKRWDNMCQCVSELERDVLTGDTYVRKLNEILTMSMDPETEKLYMETLQRQYEADLEVKAVMLGVKGVVTDVAKKQKAMASDMRAMKGAVEDVVKEQKSMASDIEALTETHPDLRPLIETTVARIKKEKEKKFLSTKAFRDAQKKLQKNKIIVIKGNTGDGKTSTAIQLMDLLIKEQQCRQPLQLHKIENLDLLSPNSNLVTCIDDIFGEKDKGNADVQEWNQRISKVDVLFDSKQTNVLLLTIRNEIFNALGKRSFGTVFTPNNIIDLSSKEYKIAEERKALLELYKPNAFSWTEEEKKRVLTCAPNVGFPQCCHLFYNSVQLQKERARFFEKPSEFLIEALSRMQECSAILFLFLNGMLRVKDLDPNNDNINKTLLDQAFNIKLFDGGDYRGPLTVMERVGFVKESLDKLIGFLVVKEYDWWTGDEMYKFNHDSIHVTVALLYWKKTPVGYIQNSPRESLKYLTISKTTLNMIAISSDEYTYLCERLLRELDKRVIITGIRSLDVWNDDGFVGRFFRYLNEKKVDKVSVLNKACDYGVANCALYLLSEGVKPNKDTAWWSLITGCGEYRKGDVDVLKKAFVYLNAEMKMDLLYRACWYGSEECASYLLEKGVKADNYTPWWPLITGIRYGGKGDVDVLTKVYPYVSDKAKLNLLNEACRSVSRDCALYLLRKGVKPNQGTGLWKLVKGSYMHGEGVDVLKEVVKYTDGKMRLKMLNQACQSGFEDCAFYLLHEGVKPDKHTLFCVVWGGSVNLLRSLEQYNVIETARYDDNNNVLHVACEEEREELVMLLCEKYPRLVRETNKSGERPLHIATRSGNRSIIQTVTRATQD
ncbi:uncharacterized protein LOC132551500 [Ylistrum balloti]|uniref:uncharacterized protein LOC132551500 n=1 Tax=Ylistrum balloti TaxID=509963 RepID=UPI002905988B|nr:uncharacterized protein LOC132551500 [Ylistrum balloti]XP_060071633.1 uncharacterized protein LOC132551500 [Ylistrum balloti]